MVRRIAIVVINVILEVQIDLIILVLDLVCPSHALFASCYMEHSVHLEVVNLQNREALPTFNAIPNFQDPD